MISLVLLWLRAAGLVGQAISLGGAIFALGVLRPARTRAAAGIFDRVLTLITFGALLAAAAQAGVLVALAKLLVDDFGWPLAALLGSPVGVIGLTRIAGALLGAAAAHALRRDPESSARSIWLLMSSVLLAVTGALARHAVGRLDGMVWLVTVGALHQGAATGRRAACATVVVTRSAPGAPTRGSGRSRRSRSPCVVVPLPDRRRAFSRLHRHAGRRHRHVLRSQRPSRKSSSFAAMLTPGVLNHRALHGRLAAGSRLTSRRRRPLTQPDRARCRCVDVWRWKRGSPS